MSNCTYTNRQQAFSNIQGWIQDLQIHKLYDSQSIQVTPSIPVHFQLTRKYVLFLAHSPNYNIFYKRLIVVRWFTFSWLLSLSKLYMSPPSKQFLRFRLKGLAKEGKTSWGSQPSLQFLEQLVAVIVPLGLIWYRIRFW